MFKPKILLDSNSFSIASNPHLIAQEKWAEPLFLIPMELIIEQACWFEKNGNLESLINSLYSNPAIEILHLAQENFHLTKKENPGLHKLYIEEMTNTIKEFVSDVSKQKKQSFQLDLEFAWLMKSLKKVEKTHTRISFISILQTAWDIVDKYTPTVPDFEWSRKVRNQTFKLVLKQLLACKLKSLISLWNKITRTPESPSIFTLFQNSSIGKYNPILNWFGDGKCTPNSVGHIWSKTFELTAVLTALDPNEKKHYFGIDDPILIEPDKGDWYDGAIISNMIFADIFITGDKRCFERAVTVKSVFNLPCKIYFYANGPQTIAQRK